VDFSLYVDEFQNFSTDSFATIMSEARKYHLNLIVANQFTTQLTEEIRDAVFGNMGTIVAFRIGQNDVESLSRYFQPTFDGDDLLRVPNYNTIVRTLIGGVPTQPFSMSTLAPLGDPNNKLSDALKQLSAAKFGRPKAAVEKEIMERIATKEAAPGMGAAGAPGGGFGAAPARSGFGAPAQGAPMGPGAARPFGGASPWQQGNPAAVPQAPMAPPPKAGTGSFLDEWLTKRGSTPIAPAAPVLQQSPVYPTPVPPTPTPVPTQAAAPAIVPNSTMAAPPSLSPAPSTPVSDNSEDSWLAPDTSTPAPALAPTPPLASTPTPVSPPSRSTSVATLQPESSITDSLASMGFDSDVPETSKTPVQSAPREGGAEADNSAASDVSVAAPAAPEKRKKRRRRSKRSDSKSVDHNSTRENHEAVTPGLMTLDHDAEDLARLEQAKAEHRQRETESKAELPDVMKPIETKLVNMPVVAEPAAPVKPVEPEVDELPPLRPRSATEDALNHGDTIYIDQEGNLKLVGEPEPGMAAAGDQQTK